MRFLYYGKDGGPESTVNGFWFIEIKSLFSIVLLIFKPGSREVYHSHAFNAYTWFLKGSVIEKLIDGSLKIWKPSIKPKYTPKNCFHKVTGVASKTYALSFRGPWNKNWQEYLPKNNEYITLENGRNIVKEQ